MGNETLSRDPPQNTSNRSGRNFLRATFLEVPFHNPLYTGNLNRMQSFYNINTGP